MRKKAGYKKSHETVPLKLVLSAGSTCTHTHPSSDLSIDPVLVVLVLCTGKLGQLGHEGGEVEEGGHCREPELLQHKIPHLKGQYLEILELCFFHKSIAHIGPRLTLQTFFKYRPRFRGDIRKFRFTFRVLVHGK